MSTVQGRNDPPAQINAKYLSLTPRFQMLTKETENENPQMEEGGKAVSIQLCSKTKLTLCEELC